MISIAMTMGSLVVFTATVVASVNTDMTPLLGVLSVPKALPRIAMTSAA
jgi:hypothetical protein